MCVRTAENPKATRQCHPLTTHIMEKPKRDGGLGMVKVSFSYCKITTAPFQSFHKPTNLWSDYVGTLELFVDSEGKHKKECCLQEGICNKYRSRVILCRPSLDPYLDPNLPPHPHPATGTART